MVVDAGFDNAGQDSSDCNAAGSDTASFGGSERRRGRAAPDLPDPRKVAEDWITLWQSELSAMAADPELREAWQTVMALWAGTMSTILRGLPRGPAAEWYGNPNAGPYDRTRGDSRAADASRTTPAAAAPDARDAEIERLARHVATLERRLANLERGGDPPVRPKRRPGGKPRK